MEEERRGRSVERKRKGGSRRRVGGGRVGRRDGETREGEEWKEVSFILLFFFLTEAQGEILFMHNSLRWGGKSNLFLLHTLYTDVS